MERCKMIMMLVCGYLCLSLNAWAAPAVDFDEPSFNAGDIVQGMVIKHDFSFTNTGDAPLRVKVNDCGCGGVTFQAPAAAVEPGKSAVITVNYPTTYSRGNANRKIQIETNDPEKKTVTLSISAQVQELISLMPSYIHFGQIEIGSANQREIVLTNNSASPIKIESCEILPGGAATLSPALKECTVKPGDKLTLTLQLTPPAKVGQIRGNAVLQTSGKPSLRKIISFQAEVNRQ